MDTLVTSIPAIAFTFAAVTVGFIARSLLHSLESLQIETIYLADEIVKLKGMLDEIRGQEGE